VKKQQRRITLYRETVRRLDRVEQGAVKGAVNFSTGDVCTSHTPYTCSTKPTC